LFHIKNRSPVKFGGGRKSELTAIRPGVQACAV